MKNGWKIFSLVFILFGCISCSSNDVTCCEPYDEYFEHNDPFEDFNFVDEGEPWFVSLLSSNDNLFAGTNITYETFVKEFGELKEEDFIISNELPSFGYLTNGFIAFLYPNIDDSLLFTLCDNKLLLLSGNEQHYEYNGEIDFNEVSDYIYNYGEHYHYYEDFKKYFN